VEAIKDRAIELALEQNNRLVKYASNHKPEEAYTFYADPFEAGICNRITRLLSLYAYHTDMILVEPQQVPV
jgi:hypothetical protein